MSRATKPKREKRIAFRLTPEQAEAYLAAAERAERELSDWIRVVLDREAGLREKAKGAA